MGTSNRNTVRGKIAPREGGGYRCNRKNPTSSSHALGRPPGTGRAAGAGGASAGKWARPRAQAADLKPPDLVAPHLGSGGAACEAIAGLHGGRGCRRCCRQSGDSCAARAHPAQAVSPQETCPRSARPSAPTGRQGGDSRCPATSLRLCWADGPSCNWKGALCCFKGVYLYRSCVQQLHFFLDYSCDTGKQLEWTAPLLSSFCAFALELVSG